MLIAYVYAFDPQQRSKKEKSIQCRYAKLEVHIHVFKRKILSALMGQRSRSHTCATKYMHAQRRYVDSIRPCELHFFPVSRLNASFIGNCWLVCRCFSHNLSSSLLASLCVVSPCSSSIRSVSNGCWRCDCVAVCALYICYSHFAQFHGASSAHTSTTRARNALAVQWRWLNAHTHTHNRHSSAWPQNNTPINM